MNQVFRGRFVRYGLPFLLLVVGGSLGLKEFAQIRYTFSKKKSFNRKEAEEMGIEMQDTRDISLESVYEEIREMDIDNWKNIRGPRPWEEPTRELVDMKSKSKKIEIP